MQEMYDKILMSQRAADSDCKEKEMKYYISISKREIITAIILIIGLMFLFKGIHSSYQINHALTLDNIDEHALKNGACVTGDIDNYIGQIMYGSGKFSGVSQTLITFESGYGKKVPFEGIIVEPPIDLNDNWYRNVEGFDTEDLIRSFVIKETDFDRNKNFVYGGVSLLAIAALLFFSAGGLKSFIMEET